MSVTIGQHIGKYRVTRQVGRGGMGTVYAAIDETLHREVAIKVLNAGLDDPTVSRRFRAEAVTVARLNHPGIAAIYELLPHDDQWLMVMEFVRGETLEHVLASEKALPVARAAEVTLQLLAALAHAHGLGVVHRDLKPANIMLAPAGAVKIMDFGIARVTGAEQLTSAGFMMGTPAYMAPEQVLGSDVDARTDLYAVGIVLFQMVTGALPFAGTTAVQLAQARVNEPPASLAAARPDLPAWLSQVIDIVLARDPGRRFQSATLFREAIRRGLAGVPIEGEISPPPASLTLGPASGRLRVVTSASTPASPQLAVDPTVAGPRSSASEPASRDAPTARGRGLVAGMAAAALLVLVSGGWWLTRPASPPAPASTTTAGATTTAQTGDAASSSPPVGAPADVPAPQATPAPAAVSTSPQASSAVVGPSAASAPAAAPAPVTAPESAATPPAAAASAVFRGVRALVLDGRRAEERPAVLAFADDVVTLFDDGGRQPIASMSYAQVTAAVYTRAREPRWYPTLAGPPIDTDMPGGLFRGNRHWLALQSRDAWMIVRMNDGDWRQITEAVTALVGLSVEQLRP